MSAEQIGAIIVGGGLVAVMVITLVASAVLEYIKRREGKIK